MSVTVLLFVIVIGGAAVISLLDYMKSKADAPAADATARTGIAPTPTARLIELPGMRLVDLRWLPRDDLRRGNVGVAREQIRLEAVLPAQIWVVDRETIDGWLELTDVALLIIAGRLRDPRELAVKNYLFVVGRTLDPGACQRLQTAGVEVVLEMTNLGDPPRTLEDFLDPPLPWAPSPNDRPISPSSVISTDPYDGELIHEVGDFVFADLRRAVPLALSNGAAVDRLRRAVDALRERPTPQVMVWVFAPWTLEVLPASAASSLRTMMRTMTPALGHRVAIVAPAGQPVVDHPVTTALREAGATALQETYEMRVKNRGVFQVPPLTALHDTYFHHAWKHPTH